LEVAPPESVVVTIEDTPTIEEVSEEVVETLQEEI